MSLTTDAVNSLFTQITSAIPVLHSSILSIMDLKIEFFEISLIFKNFTCTTSSCCFPVLSEACQESGSRKWCGNWNWKVNRSWRSTGRRIPRKKRNFCNLGEIFKKYLITENDVEILIETDIDCRETETNVSAQGPHVSEYRTGKPFDLFDIWNLHFLSYVRKDKFHFSQISKMNEFKR